MRIFLGALLALLMISCYSPADRLTDLSDRVVQSPQDGIGHYVYALTASPSVASGEDYHIAMEWRTVGPADPTQRYSMDIRLTGPATQTFAIGEAQNTVGEYHLTNWLEYDLPLGADLPVGTYDVQVRVQDRNGVTVPLGYTDDYLRPDGFYELTSVVVE